MRKLYLLAGLVVLLPASYAAGCGSGDSPGTGGSNAGSGGGMVQDFSYEIDVSWTVQQKAPTAAVCGSGATEYQVLVRLSGTEDPSAHKEKTVQCSEGKVNFTGLTRLRTGAAPLIEAYLQSAEGFTALSTSASVTPASGVVKIPVDFSTPNPETSSTAGPGPGPGSGGNGGMGGMGGMGGAGGAGGAGQSSSTGSTSSSHSAASSTAASTGTS